MSSSSNLSSGGSYSDLSNPPSPVVLHSPALNRGNAFTHEEREKLGLHGLIPHAVASLEQQCDHMLKNLRRKSSPIDKFEFLRNVHDTNETLFYFALINHVAELMPLVYTPTVGEACQRYSELFLMPRGMFLHANLKGSFREAVGNWPVSDVAMIVVTDGERILGLGDLGCNGMGIPIGKLALYTACAGVDPRKCLPVMLDVGTNNEENLNDPHYIGLRQKRLTGEAYYEVVDEFVQAVTEQFPSVVIQWEDFGNHTAFDILDKYRNKTASFNDDIQGTACVTLGAVLAACRLTKPINEHRFLFLGAGEAGVGIGDLISFRMLKSGMFDSIEEARQQCYFLDSRGLVCKSREDKLAHHKERYAHDVPYCSNLLEAVKALKPSAIIGVSAQPNTFTEEVVREMAKLNERPLVFALSNPTSKAECTAEQAYQWSDGRAIFASGSPFDDIKLNGNTFVPGQANNAYIFPGVGLAASCARARSIPEDAFLVAAESLANQVSEADLKLGSVVPPLNTIREVSFKIAVDVATFFFTNDLSKIDEVPKDITQFVKEHVYTPDYSETIPVAASL